MARRPLSLMDGTSLGGFWAGGNNVEGDRFRIGIWGLIKERLWSWAGQPL